MILASCYFAGNDNGFRNFYEPIMAVSTVLARRVSLHVIEGGPLQCTNHQIAKFGTANHVQIHDSTGQGMLHRLRVLCLGIVSDSQSASIHGWLYKLAQQG